MSEPPKKAGGGVSNVERQERAAEHKRKREEHLGYTNIVGAIHAVANQLAANEKAQEDNERDRAFREKVTIGLVLGAFVAARAWRYHFLLHDDGHPRCPTSDSFCHRRK